MNEIVEFQDKNDELKPQRTNFGKYLVGITGGIALTLTLISAPFLTPALRRYCLPYIPATAEQISNITKALQGRTGTLIDLGSGDGRIVLEGAKRDFISHGIELNPVLVAYSNICALKAGLTRKTLFIRQDLWKFNLSNYDNIVIFGVREMMNDLERKFERECKENCNIIACRFPLPNRQPIQTIGRGIDTVWVYSF